MHLIDTAIKKYKTILSTFVVLLITGFSTYTSISKESFPDVNIPYIFTTVMLRGVSPEDGERLLAKPLEQEFKGIEGVKEMSTTCYEGSCMLTLEFNAGFDVDSALDDVREAVDKAKTDFPSDVDEPIVKELNPSEFPIIIVNVAGDVPERALKVISERLQEEIEAISGVSEANISGDRKEEVQIIIDPAKINSYQISFPEVASFIAQSNKLIAAGRLENDQGMFAVKIPGLIEDIVDIMNLPIKVSGDSVIKLKDIAEIRRGFEDATEHARINGKKVLSLEVKKTTGSNTINIVNDVKNILEKAKTLIPNNVELFYTNDQSVRVKDNLRDLENSVILSVLLVMCVVILMLGARSGILVGLAIPGSFLMGILFLSLFGFTINMVVLFGLILSVGMLVDGAIVITEYADRRMTEGASPKKAYSEASKRMALPIISSTATTLAAFGPLAFWPGVVGEFMKFLPITLICTLTASLIMALIFIPVLGAFYGKSGAVGKEEYDAIVAAETGDYKKLDGINKEYYNILNWALERPKKLVKWCIGIMLFSFLSFCSTDNGVTFFPETDPDMININIHALGNLSTKQKDEYVKKIEDKLIKLPYFDTVYSVAGRGSRGASQDTIGYIQLELKDWQERPSVNYVTEIVREVSKGYAGIEIEIVKQKKGPQKGKAVQIEISSITNSQEQLISGVKYLRKAMDEVGGFTDIEDTSPIPGIQWEIKLDRAQAAKFGVTVSSIGTMVQMVTQGARFASYRPDDTDDEVDIVARYPERYRNISQLKNVQVVTNAGSVPISNFTEIIPAQKINAINRIDGKKVMTVQAELRKGEQAAKKIRELTQWAKDNPAPLGIDFNIKGETADNKEAGAFLGRAFLIALFVMAIILITQFDSFYDTALILFSILLSLTGVMFGLVMTMDSFSVVMTGISIVSLAGIVVNNNIVLIDTYSELKHKIKDKKDAIIRTGVQRLRPVLLTTITTILGLIPMALTLNIDFFGGSLSVGAPSMQMWAIFSRSVAFGLTFATVLTLIITPCMLYLGVLREEEKAKGINKKNKLDFIDKLLSKLFNKRKIRKEKINNIEESFIKKDSSTETKSNIKPL